jgi:hypothetical protein
MSALWDIQVLVYVGLTSVVVIMALLVLAVVSRRVRCLTSDVEAIRRELKLLDEGIQVVTQSLRSRGPAVPAKVAEASADAKAEEASEAKAGVKAEE